MMNQLQQMEMPTLPDNNNVEDILKSIRVRVGFEQAPDKPIDPFEQQFNEPVSTEPSMEEMWNPIISETTNELTKKQADKEAVEEFNNHPIFKHFEHLDDDLFDRMAEEIDNPETPFNQQGATELITNFIAEELDKMEGY
ncbi:hypothetical protein CWO07_24220 [Vibrio splendidus]|uniref:Uncharacterized protein n=1 Tax=Vibrio splendidus TaxID=29497 RepID=A0A2T5EJG4_VIBSP|nr:hypothetical protein [Vibrio splendidus]PTP20220.1 hypothetical protein CWO07_24220 [Vibrio splendidus]